MIRRKTGPFRIFRRLLHHLLVVAGAVILALVFFLVLPLMQTLNKPTTTDLIVQEIDTGKIDAPEPPPEPEPEEPEPEEPPPKLAEQEAPPLDISQIEMALNPGFSDGFLAGDFAVKLNTVVANTQEVASLFSIADLDQKPRPIYQPGPMLNSKIRKSMPGTVYIIFVVDENGRVQNPKVQSSDGAVFEKAALNAVKKWKFEPGKRNGKPVRFRMRVPIIFKG